MTRSTIRPLRRFAAAAAIAGVTGFGAVALAPAALADEPAAPVTTSTTVSAPATAPTTVADDPADDYSIDYTTVTGRDGQQWIISPLPDKAIDAKIGRFKVKLNGWAAQAYQTVEANLDVSKGLTIWFDGHGLLHTGTPKCNPKKAIEDQPLCIAPHGPRF